MKAKRKAAIKAIENAVADFSRIQKLGRCWEAVEEVDRLMLKKAKDAMAGLWRDAEVRPHWNKALELYWQITERVTPFGFWDDFQKLKVRDASGLESGIAFLEADPWFFRSGYIKEWLATFIRRLPLSPKQEDRLRRVVLHIAATRDEREFRYFCRLARRVTSDDLRQQLEELSCSDDANVRRRATWMLNYCRN